MLVKPLPAAIYNLYSSFGFLVRLYVYFRWQLCPFEKISEFVPREGKIIDIGSGFGLLANYLALASVEREVVGVDSSVKRINIALRTIGARRGIQFLAQDVRHFTWVDFSTIVMSDVLHHIPFADQEDLLAHIFQRLPKRGRLIILDVDKRPYWKYLMASGIDYIVNLGEQRFYRPVEDWEGFLERIGFSVQCHRVDRGLPLPDILLVCEKP